jgi:hypothetical protein
MVPGRAKGEHHMAIHIESVTWDCADPVALARWWAQALGWPEPFVWDDGDATVSAPADGSGAVGVRRLDFLRVPEGKAVKNRLHLDLRPDDQDAEIARFEALGARRVDVGQTTADTFVVLADPEGNEFCILRSGPLDIDRSESSDHEP